LWHDRWPSYDDDVDNCPTPSPSSCPITEIKVPYRYVVAHFSAHEVLCTCRAIRIALPHLGYPWQTSSHVAAHFLMGPMLRHPTPHLVRCRHASFDVQTSRLPPHIVLTLDPGACLQHMQMVMGRYIPFQCGAAQVPNARPITQNHAQANKGRRSVGLL